MGLGLSMVIPFYNSLSMFIGASMTLVITKKWPSWGDSFIIPVASGVIAGESLLGVLIALLAAGGLV